MVLVDICGPILTVSIKDNTYSLICTDSWTYWRDVNFFSKKGDAGKHFVKFKARTELFH